MRKLLMLIPLSLLAMSCDVQQKPKADQSDRNSTANYDRDAQRNMREASVYDRDNTGRNVRDRNGSYASDERENVREASTYDRDNTGRNVRDRNDPAILPTDQSESRADRTLTQQIRSRLMDDDSLSTNAKNIKVITNEGIVILRGPVNSKDEKARIILIVKDVSGIKNVNDQLEVIERR
jgi:osmotically-inducible protein OsmY